MSDDITEFLSTWTRENAVDGAERYIRYAEGSRADADMSDKEDGSHVGVSIPEVRINADVTDESLCGSRADIDLVRSGSEFHKVRVDTDDAEASDSVVLDEPDERSERAPHLCGSHLSSMAAVFSFSVPTRVGSKYQNIQGGRRSSLYLNAISSTTSERTMIDYGYAVDQVRVQTPDCRRSACKDLVRAYLSQSSKRHPYRTSCNVGQQRKICARMSHDTNFSNRSKSENKKIIRASSSGIHYGRSSGAGFHCKDCRSMSCPTIPACSLMSCAHKENMTRTNTSSHMRQRPSLLDDLAECGRTKKEAETRFSDMAQYRLAVLHVKKARCAESIREILAKCNEYDKDEEEEENDNEDVEERQGEEGSVAKLGN